MVNAFQQGQQFGVEQRKRRRVEKGVRALADEFGDQALAPAEFATVRASDRAERGFVAEEAQRVLNNQLKDTTAANLEEDRRRADQLRASQALVSFYQKGIKSGVPVEQITARAGPVLSALGVDPADHAGLSAQIQQDPTMLDSIAAALKAQSGTSRAVTRQRPIKVENPDGTLRFMVMDEATGEFVDTGLVPAQSVQAQQRLDISQQNVDVKQAGPQGDIAESKVVGAARGEVTAGDLARGKRETAAAKLAVDARTERFDLVTNTIDKAVDQAGIFSAGLLSLTDVVPGSPAANLSATLATVKANIGFEELQRLRDGSKTGGALGQVSEMENILLQSVWGSVEASQSPSQLRGNLRVLKQTLALSRKRVEDAFQADFETDFGGAQTAPAGGGARLIFNPETGQLE